MYWPPTVINAWCSSGVIKKGACVGLAGTFSPDCLESLTPETYTSGGLLFQCGPLCTGHGAGVAWMPEGNPA